MTRTLIQNGFLVDPKNDLNDHYDVLIQDGLIKEVSKNIISFDGLEECEVVDATGLIVCPGLIDFHVHCYEYATPLGINADNTCLAKGVTTVVDAGSTGASTFTGLQKYVIEKSKTRVKAFLHIANHGLASAGCTGVDKGGECDSLNQVNVQQNIDCIKANSDDIVGIKVRLAEAVCDDGKNEIEVYKRALKASELSGKPLMVHHAFSSIPVRPTTLGCLTCPGSLKLGDVYTHTYHSIIVEKGKVSSEYIKARSKGVIFDLGHGGGSFDWDVASACAKEKFWPDIISTDLHTSSIYGPAYNLSTVMSKLLYLGMPLYEVIKAVTWTPAKAMKMDDYIGALSPGMVADVTLLKYLDSELKMEDCHQQIKILTKQLKPCLTWRDGMKYTCI